MEPDTGGGGFETELIVHANQDITAATTYQQFRPRTTAPTSGWAMIQFGGFGGFDWRMFAWADLPTRAVGGSSARDGTTAMYWVGGGNHRWYLARDASDNLLVAAMSAVSDPMPLRIQRIL